MDLLANFSLDVLRYYVKIATLKNYTQASRELYISQPTLSRHIKALETRLGKKLFFRTKCGVELTEDGQHFYEKCCHLLAVYDDFVQDVTASENHASISGSLNIMYQRPVRNLIRTVNADFQRSYPGIKLKCDLLSTSDPVQPLIDGSADCIYMYECEYRRIRRKNLLAIPVCKLDWGVTMSAENALANKQPIRLEDLADQNFIITHRSVSPAVFDEIYAACNRAGFVPKASEFTKDVENIITYILIYNAVAIMADGVYNFSSCENVVYRKLDNYPFSCVFYLVALEDKMSPPLRLYYSALQRNYFLNP